MFKKIGFILLCCMIFTSCENSPQDLEPKYLRSFPAASHLSVEDYLVPDDFVNDEMAAEIKKVLKKHKVKDGPIDEETALDIATLVVKYHYSMDFFQKQTVYCISPNSDEDVFWLLISQEVVSDEMRNGLAHIVIAIHQISGAVVAYNVTY